VAVRFAIDIQQRNEKSMNFKTSILSKIIYFIIRAQALPINDQEDRVNVSNLVEKIRSAVSLTRNLEH
jgi:hypothetical protein